MDDITENAARVISELMCASARTAPKAKGFDDIKLAIVQGKELERIAAEMEEISYEKGWGFFLRDAKNIRECSSLVLIGVGNKPLGLNCGACGGNCESLLESRREGTDFPGPICVFKSMDLGIALSSAAKTASMHNADNRMMYTAGLASKRLGLIEGDLVIGIPISIKGKNIFFDRKR